MTHEAPVEEAPWAEPGAEGLFARLPVDLLASLTPEQRATLWEAAQGHTWRRYPVNIRLSLPLGPRRLFLTVVAGQERRNQQRLARERRMHKLFTLGNLLFVLGIASAFYLVAVFVLFLAGGFGTP